MRDSGVTPVWQDTATGFNNGHNRFTILTTFYSLYLLYTLN